jgi:protein-S-isoprenylcysteine O-methyltransferase Ste14
MERDPFTDLVGVALFVLFCLFMVFWNLAFDRQSEKPRRWFVWIPLLFAILGIVGLLWQMGEL